MNTPNNRRRRASMKRIEEAFLHLLEHRELESITVSELCELSDLNRSTFYANYRDIYDLADRVRDRLAEEVEQLFRAETGEGYTGGNFLGLFCHIRDNQLRYRVFFKLGYDSNIQLGCLPYDREQAEIFFGGEHVEYHMEFFRSGFNALVKIWLVGGCKEPPEELNEILMAEYQGRRLPAPPQVS